MIKQVGGLLIGTATNNDAPSGYVGEYISATVLVGAAVSLTTGVVANIASISLAAGDWDVSGVVSYHSASGTTVPNDVLQGVSPVSATTNGPGSFSYDYIAVAIPDDPTYVAPATRLSLAATTTVYLISKADFAVSTLTAYGFIRARRVR